MNTVLPLLLFAAAATLLSAGLLGVSALVGPSKSGRVKEMPYESGMDPIHDTARRFDIPLITGATGNAEREDLYGKFRRGEVRHLVLSKVGNFAIDLPDANVLIQVSGTFGSRQEEAQRLGRILRPKSSGEGDAHFYTLVTRDTRELDFAHHRQMFLTEQGYSYAIADEADVLAMRTAGCECKRARAVPPLRRWGRAQPQRCRRHWRWRLRAARGSLSASDCPARPVPPSP